MTSVNKMTLVSKMISKTIYPSISHLLKKKSNNKLINPSETSRFKKNENKRSRNQTLQR
jgi:hypothetical protein